MERHRPLLQQPQIRRSSIDIGSADLKRKLLLETQLITNRYRHQNWADLHVEQMGRVEGLARALASWCGALAVCWPSLSVV